MSAHPSLNHESATLCALIEELVEFPERLRALCTDLSPLALRRAPSGGGFSMVEHACHLRDYEEAGCLGRMLRMLVEQSPTLEEFDGAGIAVARSYSDQGCASAIRDFAALRLTTVRVVTALSAEQLQRTATIGQAGVTSIRQLIEMVAGHDKTHLHEIDSLLAEMRAVDAADGEPAQRSNGEEYDRDVQQLRVAIQDFIAAYNAGDLAGVMKCYDEGLIKLRHGAPAAGRGETERRISGVLRTFAGELSVVNDEIVVSGDLALVRGEFRLTLTPRSGGAIQKVARRFLEIWRKSEGQWAVFRTMDNVAARGEEPPPSRRRLRPARKSA